MNEKMQDEIKKSLEDNGIDIEHFSIENNPPQSTQCLCDDCEQEQIEENKIDGLPPILKAPDCVKTHCTYYFLERDPQTNSVYLMPCNLIITKKLVDMINNNDDDVDALFLSTDDIIG